MSTSERFSTERFDHEGKAASAAVTAAFTSACSLRGIRLYTLPVDGSTLSRVFPETAETNSPLM